MNRWGFAGRRPLPDEPRGAWRLLADPVFGPIFFGKTISAAGIWIHNIVAAVLTYELTGSALLVGLVSGLQFLPQLLFAPLSGATADRGHAKRQIIVGRIVTAIGSGGLAVWIWVGPQNDGFAGALPILLSSLVVGLGFVVGGPAMQSIIPKLVRDSELAPAVTLNVIPPTVARAMGPVLGAGLAVSLGDATAFALAAASSVAFCIVAAAVLPDDERKPARAHASVRDGMRYVMRDRAMRALMLAIAAVGVGAEPSITLTPSLSDDLVGNSELTGWLVSAFGAGAGLGFFAVGAVRTRWGSAVVSTVGLGLMTASLCMLIAAWEPYTTMVALAVGGVGMTFATTGLTTQVLARAPESFRGRVMAVWLMASLGARPVAAAMNGGLADAFSIEIALLACAVLVFSAAVLSRPSRVGLPAPSAAEFVRRRDSSPEGPP